MKLSRLSPFPLFPPPSSPFPLLSPSVHSAGPLIWFPLIRVRLSLPRRLGRLCKLRKLLKIQVFLFVFRFSLFVFRLAFGKYSLTANARRARGGEGEAIVSQEFHKAEQRKHTRHETRDETSWEASLPFLSLPLCLPLFLPVPLSQAQSKIYKNVTEKPHSTQKSLNFCSGRGSCLAPPAACLLFWAASCAPFSFLYAA